MEIQYVLINFLILAAIIVLFCRKTIIRMFSERRKQINLELDEAERIEQMEEPVEPEFAASVDHTEVQLAVDAEKAEAKEKLLQVQKFGERECNEIHRTMIENTRKKFFSIMDEKVGEIFSKEPYRTEMKKKESALIDEILGMIKLTPGDMSYIKHHGVLYVTLTSAYPLEESLVKGR